MISGSRALSEIERAISHARTNEQRLDAALVRALAEVARLRQARSDAFRELARVKLEAVQRNDMVGELDAAERRAVELVERHRAAVAELAERRTAAQAALETEQAARDRHAEALEQAVDALEATRARIAQETQAGAEWRARKAAVEQAAKTAAAASGKADQADADRAEKGKPYEQDPLFIYLWNRKFGTADYRAGFLARYLDGKVARLVGYHDARPNYWMLNEIPARLHEHAERRKQEAEAARQDLARFERERLVAGGIAPLEETAAAAKAALDTADAKLASMQSELARLDEAHAQAVATGSRIPEEAVTLVADSDAQEDLRELYREARQTATPADEAIVRRIEETDRALLRANQEVQRVRELLETMALRRGELERERGDFRRRGHHGPWGEIDDRGQLGDTLGRVLTGAIKGAVLGGILRDGWRPRHGPPDFGGGPGFPFPGPGGGWSGPPSGGGGDGFKTGGSF